MQGLLSLCKLLRAQVMHVSLGRHPCMFRPRQYWQVQLVSMLHGLLAVSKPTLYDIHIF